MGAETAHEFNI